MAQLMTKTLFTGASSFTGYWFIKELVRQGSEVSASFTKSSFNEYDGTRKQRVQKLQSICQPIWNCKFGDDKFIKLIEEEKFDIFCHHAADITNYKTPEFNVSLAVNNNTNNILPVFEILKKNNCKTIVVTGSVFEQNEGCGSKPLRAFSPYGLSKGLTFNIFKHYSDNYNIKSGKFVIPNPFGPYEEPRFTTYLIKNWIQNSIPTVNTPSYVRDNIHVSLLAKAYALFVVKVYTEKNHFQKLNPSGYVESQGDFTRRFANEIRKRTNLNCEYELKDQTKFPEPEVRINTDIAARICKDWNEDTAWDELVDFYKGRYF